MSEKTGYDNTKNSPPHAIVPEWDICSAQSLVFSKKCSRAAIAPMKKLNIK